MSPGNWRYHFTYRLLWWLIDQEKIITSYLANPGMLDMYDISFDWRIYMQLTECVTRVDEDAITWPHGPSGGRSLQNIWQLDKKPTGQGIPNGQLRWESTLTFLSRTTKILTSRQLCSSNAYSMRPGFRLFKFYVAFIPLLKKVLSFS